MGPYFEHTGALSRIRPLAGLLLVPYQLWVTFATILNFRIWQLNRDKSAMRQYDRRTVDSGTV
ncbi:MAG: TspO/MBR family protein [Caldilineaceae bacterium]